MNILFTIGWPLGQGGHINSTLSLIEAIQISDNNQIRFFLLAPRGPKKSYFEKLGVTCFEVPQIKNDYWFNFIFFFWLILIGLKNKFDIIHSMDFKSLKPLTYFNIFFRKKIIFTKAGGRPLLNQLPKVSGVIVYSSELLDYYKKSYHNKAKNNFILIKERIVTNYKRYSIDVNDSTQKLFIAMRLKVEKKGLLDNLFQAFLGDVEIKNKIELTIAGGGELFDHYYSISQRITKKFNGVKINFLGEVNDKDLIQQFNKSSNFIIGHGRGIMEAMVIGKPVIQLGFDRMGSVLVTHENTNRLSYYNFSGRNLEVSEKDVTLQTIITDLDWKNFQKNDNRNYILEEYDANIGAKKTIEFYKNVIVNSRNENVFNILWMFKNQIDLLNRILKKIGKQNSCG